MAKEINLTPWDGIIVTGDNTCFGKVPIAGTRHSIDHPLVMIEGGQSFDGILETSPGLARPQLAATMGFLRDFVAGKRNRLKGDPSRCRADQSDGDIALGDFE